MRYVWRITNFTRRFPCSCLMLCNIYDQGSWISAYAWLYCYIGKHSKWGANPYKTIEIEILFLHFKHHGRGKSSARGLVELALPVPKIPFHWRCYYFKTKIQRKSTSNKKVEIFEIYKTTVISRIFSCAKTFKKLLYSSFS